MLAILAFADKGPAQPLDASFASAAEAQELVLVRSGPGSFVVERAGAVAVREFVCPPGVARQINVGLQHITADWVWVLPAAGKPTKQLALHAREFIQSAHPAIAWVAGQRGIPAWLAKPICLAHTLCRRCSHLGLIATTDVLRSLGGADETVREHRVWIDLLRRAHTQGIRTLHLGGCFEIRSGSAGRTSRVVHCTGDSLPHDG